MICNVILYICQVYLISHSEVTVMLVFVCLSACQYVYMCVRNPISHHNFVKYGPIFTR